METFLELLKKVKELKEKYSLKMPYLQQDKKHKFHFRYFNLKNFKMKKKFRVLL